MLSTLSNQTSRGLALLTSIVKLHLATVAPAAMLGIYLMFWAKGTKPHRLLGKIYMTLMLITALTSMFIPAAVGPQFLGHFGWIHLLSILVIVSVPKAYLAAKRHDVTGHKFAMIGVYIGGILVAGLFTLAPGRYIHQLIFA
tara:strand:+ start:160 stop:585 length:426 start_codon:yes stop_codon:yes gene_type:complete